MQHNKNATKSNDPMTLDQFRRNVRGTNDGGDHDQVKLFASDYYISSKMENAVIPAPGLTKIKVRRSSSSVKNVLLYFLCTSHVVTIQIILTNNIFVFLFHQDMLAEVYHAIRNEEIVMPAEHPGLVKENYLWKCALKRGQVFSINHSLFWE